MDDDWLKPYTDMAKAEFKSWEKVQLEIKYRELIPVVTAYARKKGYAIGVHGSLKRDLDLMAAPWTDRAVSSDELAVGIMKHLDGLPAINFRTDKPCGRVSFAIMLLSNKVEGKRVFGYIDLSVCPKK